MFMIFYIFIRAWLGNEIGDCMFVADIDPLVISTTEALCGTPDTLALKLVSVLFRPEELASGNCTAPKKEGIMLLDQKKIFAIRCK